MYAYRDALMYFVGLVLAAVGLAGLVHPAAGILVVGLGLVAYAVFFAGGET